MPHNVAVVKTALGADAAITEQLNITQPFYQNVFLVGFHDILIYNKVIYKKSVISE